MPGIFLAAKWQFAWVMSLIHTRVRTKIHTRVIVRVKGIRVRVIFRVRQFTILCITSAIIKIYTVIKLRLN